MKSVFYKKYRSAICLAVTRYIDDVITTINLLAYQMIVKLEKAKQRDANIGITYSLTMAVDFLDVGIENYRISQISC